MGVFESYSHETAEEDLEELGRLCQLAKDGTDDLGYGPGVSRAVEVGTWMGSSALVLAEHFERTYCVDHWLGNPNDRLGEIAQQHEQEELIEAFCRNMGSNLMDSVIPLVGTSDFWASVWPWPVALVFIDANHDYSRVKNDILNWRRNLLPGSVLAGHDFQSFPGVTRAVNELIPSKELMVVGNVWSTICR